MYIAKITLAVVITLFISSVKVMANDNRWNFNIETGAVWQERNDVQIPGDTGTQFSLVDHVGQGPFAFYRLELFYNLRKIKWSEYLKFVLVDL